MSYIQTKQVFVVCGDEKWYGKMKSNVVVI